MRYLNADVVAGWCADHEVARAEARACRRHADDTRLWVEAMRESARTRAWELVDITARIADAMAYVDLCQAMARLFEERGLP